MAAWKGGHRPGATQQQWAFARVNSMLTGGKADPDLQKQIKQGGYKDKKKKKESYEIGVDYAKHTFSVTPGQNYNQSVKQKANRTSIQDWFENESTRKRYQEKYQDYWWTALTETYDRMLDKMNLKDNSIDKYLEENKAEYDGRKVSLNNPTRSDNPKKKYMVYVRNDKGNVVKVYYGDPNMEIKRDDPARRKSFRARHNCDNPGPKYKARYWSCKFWEKGKSVTDLMKG
jgi:superfamily I DNA and/or RNA helicase